MMLALTFDDGPNTTTTNEVLDLLEEHGIVASFFLISQNINEASAASVRRAVSMGCEINNHTVTHRAMDQLTPEEIRREVRECSERIVEITGIPPRFFRPPYIAVNDALFDLVELPFICGVGCRDWEPAATSQERIDLLREKVRDGDLILLHDMTGNVNTVEALRVIIPEFKARGFRFVTCSELFREAGVTPQRGILYSNVHQTVRRDFR